MTAPTLAISHEQHRRSLQSLAGGAASAVRMAQRPFPITFERGRGSTLWDCDGNSYVDYVLAYGPMLLGHSPEPVLEAVRSQLDRGLGFGASHRHEPALAELICATVPCADLCVVNSTGTEAIQTALRIARAATGRSRVVKFLGHYHGWTDSIYVGSFGQGDLCAAGTAGQDPLAASSVTVVRWPDLRALEAALSDDVAAVVLEPIAVNAGCFVPDPEYLQGVADIVRRSGAVLVFDETVTGFRVALGGAQEAFGVIPDLVVLGKAMGSGFPISAVAGRADVMDVIATGRVTHMGTFNANPVAAAAAVATVEHLSEHAGDVYPALRRRTEELAAVMIEEAASAGLPVQVNHHVGVAHGFVAEAPVDSYGNAVAADDEAYRRFAEQLLLAGVHVIPKGILYVSTQHTAEDLERTRAAVRRAAARVVDSLSTSSTEFLLRPEQP